MSTCKKRLRSLHDILLVDKGVLKNANCLKNNLFEISVPSLHRIDGETSQIDTIGTFNTTKFD